MNNKLIFLLILSVFSFSLANAQGFYIGVNGGYGLGAAKESGQDSKSTTSGGVTNTTRSSNAFSYGKGSNFGISVGYMIKRSFGVELGASYLLGSTHTSTFESIDSDFNFNYKDVTDSKGTMIRLIPAVRVTLGEKKLTAFSRAGIIIGLGSKMISVNDYSNTFWGFGTSSHRKTEYTGGLSFGVHGALGLNYMVSKRIGMTFEVNGNYQDWAMKKSEMTEYTSNGTNMLANYSVSERETIYVDNYTEDGSTTNPNEPSKQTKEYLPFSSVGLSLGIHISLAKSESKK